MRILYVVSMPLEMNTSASIRNRATISGLLENGHDVEILTTAPDCNHKTYDANMASADLAPTQYIKLNGTQRFARISRRLKLLAPLRRFVYHWMMRHEIYDNLKGIVSHISEVDLTGKQYEVIISSSDPKSSHLFVYELLKKSGYKCQWIQIWGDPFVGDITNRAQSKMALIRREEEKLLNAADKIIYVSEMTKETQACNYPDCAEKMYAYPIPYMEERITQNRALSQTEQVSLLYCGDYDPPVRNLVPLFNIAKQLPGVTLTICGNSSQPMTSCGKVIVHARVPYQQVVQMEAEADILVHLSNLHGSQIPGKIYQLSSTNKPILFILDGDSEKLRHLFSQYDRYEFAENHEASIKAAVLRIVSGHSTVNIQPVAAFSKRKVASDILDEA